MATEVGRSYVTMVTKGYSTGEWGVATQKNRTLPQISNLGLVFFSGFLGCTPPSVDGEQLVEGMLWGRRAGLINEERERPRGNVHKLHITKVQNLSPCKTHRAIRFVLHFPTFEHFKAEVMITTMNESSTTDGR